MAPYPESGHALLTEKELLDDLQPTLLTKGPFNIYVNRILTFFDHPPTPSKQTQ